MNKLKEAPKKAVDIVAKVKKLFPGVGASLLSTGIQK